MSNYNDVGHQIKEHNLGNNNQEAISTQLKQQLK